MTVLTLNPHKIFLIYIRVREESARQRPDQYPREENRGLKGNQPIIAAYEIPLKKNYLDVLTDPKMHSTKT